MWRWRLLKEWAQTHADQRYIVISIYHSQRRQRWRVVQDELACPRWRPWGHSSWHTVIVVRVVVPQSWARIGPENKEVQRDDGDEETANMTWCNVCENEIMVGRRGAGMDNGPNGTIADVCILETIIIETEMRTEIPHISRQRRSCGGGLLKKVGRVGTMQ